MSPQLPLRNGDRAHRGIGSSFPCLRCQARKCAALLLSVLPLNPALAVVVETDDRDAWFDAASAVTTIGFTGFPHGTFVTEQYAKLGILFLDGNDMILCCDYATFPMDGAGLHGNAAIHLAFLEPKRWFASDFPASPEFHLFWQGEPVFMSEGSSQTDFLGFLSTTPFDEVIIAADHGATLDDLHFGGLPVGDLNGDDSVDVSDLLALLTAWGTCPVPCPAECVSDLDGNDVVGVPDMLALLAAWGPNPGHAADLDRDGMVGVVDLLALLQAFGPCPVMFPPTCAPDLDGDCDVGIADMLALLENWG